jgi:L-asparaginase
MLRELGVILGGELPGQKARIKLMVALGLTSDLVRLREVFEGSPRA